MSAENQVTKIEKDLEWHMKQTDKSINKMLESQTKMQEAITDLTYSTKSYLKESGEMRKDIKQLETKIEDIEDYIMLDKERNGRFNWFKDKSLGVIVATLTTGALTLIYHLIKTH